MQESDIIWSNRIHFFSYGGLNPWLVLYWFTPFWFQTTTKHEKRFRSEEQDSCKLFSRHLFICCHEILFSLLWPRDDCKNSFSGVQQKWKKSLDSKHQTLSHSGYLYWSRKKHRKANVAERRGEGDSKAQIENVEQIVVNSRAVPSFSLH